MAGGRPSKFTPQAKDRILQAISLGLPLNMSAQAGGVTYDCLNRWLKRGERRKRGEFADFFRSVKETESRVAMKLMAVIDKAAFEGSWAAAVWKMERRFPKDFGRSKPEAAGLSDAARTEQLAEALEKARQRVLEHERSQGSPPFESSKREEA